MSIYVYNYFSSSYGDGFNFSDGFRGGGGLDGVLPDNE